MLRKSLLSLEIKMKNILLLSGGGGTEHEISLISSSFIRSQLPSEYKVIEVTVDKHFHWSSSGESCELNFKKELITQEQKIKIDFAIPCFHGTPGETGEIQAYFELIQLPYLGCNPETSLLCFNKLSTKLWLEKVGIKTTPFHIVKDLTTLEIEKATEFMSQHQTVYVKATNQGSSVGCYRCVNSQELESSLKEAFNFSPYVIIEKEIIGRELEVAIFEHNDKVHITKPGEIDCPSNFYSYEEKYNENSKTTTHVEAPNITDLHLDEIYRQATAAYHILKLRHLSRVDFFLADSGEVFINEINTFPGHTKISMFPMMMQNYGIEYSEWIKQIITELS